MFKMGGTFTMMGMLVVVICHIPEACTQHSVQKDLAALPRQVFAWASCWAQLKPGVANVAAFQCLICITCPI
jgi:hypothetical protein